MNRLRLTPFSTFFCVLLISIAASFSCKLKRETKLNSNPISVEIDEFSKSATCPDASVKEMIFKNKIVYFFDEGSCKVDLQSKVLDSDGKLIGYIGGFTGNTILLEEDFSHAKEKQVLWMKTANQ
jgi:hypothetical protein